MAFSMWNPDVRARFAARVQMLTADSTPAWGKLTVSGMLAHLNDSYRMAFGDLKVAPKNVPLRYPPIKQLAVYVLPMPKGLPTAPELLQRCSTASLVEEQQVMAVMFERLGAVKPGDPLTDHPAFGALSHNAYGVLLARHTDHHLRQFKV